MIVSDIVNAISGIEIKNNAGGALVDNWRICKKISELA